MRAYLLRRVLAIVPVLLGVSLLAFTLANLAPADPAEMVLRAQMTEDPTPAQIEVERERMGLNEPVAVRYVIWLGEVVRGDVGTSFRTGDPVGPELWSRFLVTLRLAGPALLISLSLSLSVGVLSAIRRNKLADHGGRLAALVLEAIPGFWLGYLLIVAFAVNLGWLPVSGRGSWEHFVLPAVTMGVGTSAGLMRLTRSSLLEVMGEDYITSARARGLPRRTVIGEHAFKNAMIPVVTVAGLILANFLTASIIVEEVFNWPGIGKHIIQSIFNRDYPVIQAFVLFTGTLYVVINLVVDLIYTWLDPRIRLTDH